MTMSKGVRGSTKTARDQDDAELLDLCHQHDKLWRKWGRADDPMKTADLMDQCEWIARRVVGLPVFTAGGLAAKRRVLRLAEFDDPCKILESVLHFDAERIAALMRA
jgi:hypothetical protein